MKKILISFVLLSAIVCSSCVWQKAEENSEFTQRGKQIYDSWNNATQAVLGDFVDQSFKFNTWLLANDSVKPIIQERWFPYYQIQNDGNGVFRLYEGGELAFSINTGNHALTDSLSSWTIATGTENLIYCSDAYQLSIHTVTISRSLNNGWNILIDSAQNIPNLGSWILHINNPMPQSLSACDYQLTGNGVFALQNRNDNSSDIFINYNITEPFTQSFFMPTLWRQGAVTLTAINNDNERIEIQAFVVDENKVRITDSGVTETWDVND